MRFSIVTPSFRGSRWLRLCIASVADQDLEHEHIVQDAGSDDGTLDWLSRDPRVKAFVEKDRGMYDAVNRGLRRAGGDLLAYLNCDEQYLPGALARVAEYFERHPEVEVVFADTVVADQQGHYICHRTCSLPRHYHTLVSGNLAVLTCSTFFRRSVIDRHGIFFNADRRDVGDSEWVLELLKHRVPSAVLRGFTSVFSDTGENMSLRPNAARERRELFDSAPAWARRAKPLIVLGHRLRRFSEGHYWQKPFSYAIYTLESPERRRSFDVPKPTFRWVR